MSLMTGFLTTGLFSLSHITRCDNEPYHETSEGVKSEAKAACSATHTQDMNLFIKEAFVLFVCLICCFTSTVNSLRIVGTVSYLTTLVVFDLRSCSISVFYLPLLWCDTMYKNIFNSVNLHGYVTINALLFHS